jgi:hypothetical protein
LCWRIIHDEILFNKYKIYFDEQEKNTLKYAHGEGENYSKHKRIATQLAARVLYNIKDII